VAAVGTAASRTTIERRLRDYRPPPARWAEWQCDEPELRGRGYADVRRLLLDRECHAERKDALLLALVRRAGRDSEASMCVIACLYPGLSRIARRYGGVLGRDEAWGGLAEALIRRLGTFDPTHRSRFVAANLLRDAGHDLRRVMRRELWWRERVQLHEEPALEMPSAADGPHSGDPLAEDARLTVLDAALIRATRVGGLSLRDAAALLGLSYEAAKKRRQRAEAEWLSRSGLSARRNRHPKARHLGVAA
jgi:hypothetical protein